MKYLKFRTFWYPTLYKAIPVEDGIGPEGYGILRLSEFLDSLRVKVVRWSARPTGRLLPPLSLLVLITVRGWVDRDVTVRPKRWSQWNIPITPPGIRTHNILAWSVASQPTTPPRTPSCFLYNNLTTKSTALFILLVMNVILGLLPYWIFLDKILLGSITILKREKKCV
jgi:hypothetical protein